jgi:hypothetical protein
LKEVNGRKRMHNCDKCRDTGRIIVPLEPGYELAVCGCGVVK